MIVCICRGVSARTIREAIEDGARSVRDLQRCGIGDQCGSCHNVLRQMLAVAAAERAEIAAAGALCPDCSCGRASEATAGAELR